MTDPVKAKIIELIPEIKSYNHNPSGYNMVCRNCKKVIDYGDTSICEEGFERPITLADVLRAISEGIYAIEPLELSNKETLYIISDAAVGENEDTFVEWNLKKDYDGQTDEVKRFICSLIGL